MTVQGRLVASIGRGGKLGDTSSVQVNAPQAICPMMQEQSALASCDLAYPSCMIHGTVLGLDFTADACSISRPGCCSAAAVAAIIIMGMALDIDAAAVAKSLGRL